jgi:hypothetical protein
MLNDLLKMDCLCFDLECEPGSAPGLTAINCAGVVVYGLLGRDVTIAVFGAEVKDYNEHPVLANSSSELSLMSNAASTASMLVTIGSGSSNLNLNWPMSSICLLTRTSNRSLLQAEHWRLERKQFCKRSTRKRH